MLCENCGKNIATTNIKSVVNGVATEINLCNECAIKGGYHDIGKSSFAQLLASMLGDTLTLSPAKETLRCPCCNLSFSDIAKTGKAGCSKCYETFYNELLPSIRRIHGGTVHSGKIPNKAPLVVKQEADTVESLRVRLNELVREEKYEEAAIIRDKIKKAEEETK